MLAFIQNQRFTLKSVTYYSWTELFYYVWLILLVRALRPLTLPSLLWGLPPVLPVAQDTISAPPRAVNPYPKPRHQQPLTDLRCTLVVVSPAPSLSPCPAAGCTLTLVPRLPCLGLPPDPIAGPGSAQRGQTLRDSACWREGTGCPRVTLAPSSLSLREQAALAAPWHHFFPISKLLFLPFSEISCFVVLSFVFLKLVILPFLKWISIKKKKQK